MILLNTLQQAVIPIYCKKFPATLPSGLPCPIHLHCSHQPHPLLLLFYLTASKVFSSCSFLTVTLKAIVNIPLKSFLVAKMKTNSNFKTKVVSNPGSILEVSMWHNSQLHPQTVNWQKVQIINYKCRTFSKRLQHKYQRRLISKNDCSTRDQKKKKLSFWVFFFMM